MKTARLLGAILVMQALVLIGQFSGGRGSGTPVYGQIPDGGGQRAQTVDELKALNSKMEKLIDLLASGKVEVKLAPADEKDK